MPKKGQKLSEEQKAKMRAGREAKKAGPQPTPTPSTTINQDTVDQLLRRIEELESRAPEHRYPADSRYPEPNQGQVNRGKIVGQTERYSVDPNAYPDPTPRLAKEARLKRFAFDENYVLTYKFNTTTYENINGIRMVEPRFHLELARKIFDDEDNLVKMAVVAKAIFHEDPDAAIYLAREQGIEVGDDQQFLDEMRYLRMRDWLLEAFYPPVSTDKKSNKKQEVIGGKLVETYEVSGEQVSGIPFNSLKKYS